MTERQHFTIPPVPAVRARSGRRFAVDIDSPRDRTVCFTVSEEERVAVDKLAGCLNRTRSSVLTRIVTAFVADWRDGDEPERVLGLFREYRAAVKKNQIPPNRI